MDTEKKKRIGIIFGGRSGEHEISILSGAAVLAAIDREKYEPVVFAIGKDGFWNHLAGGLEDLTGLDDPRISGLFETADPVTISEFDSMTDFAFPLLHGPYGEDGTIQGLFEMLGKPYAGCGVASAALSMDKIFTKEVWGRLGFPQCGYTYTTAYLCSGDSGLSNEAGRIGSTLGYPLFVKPANMGSSVGVSKAENRDGLKEAIKTALKYDRRVIAEQAINGRELEIGLLGGAVPEASAVGEIISGAIYYDYDSKYRGGETKLVIPAKIPDAVKTEIETLALKAYMALDGEGFARIDLFYDESTGKIYLSEMNAIPGFTRYSMFPLLWEIKGIGFKVLIERIIELGYERHNA